MADREVRLRGLAYLEAVTELLQRARLQSPTAGIWEAADLNWWWRKPRASDGFDQRVLVDDQDQPVATAALIDWGEQWAVEPLVLPDHSDLLPRIWSQALDDIDRLGVPSVETSVADDDRRLVELATAAGFTPAAGYGETWMDVGDRPVVPATPGGFTVCDRVIEAGRPHHMEARNGPDVAARLAQTLLYRPDLDLCVRDGDGQLAAYALFWYDPVTAVGMLEPMRTEDGYQRRGMGGLVLREGLSRLAALGATRLKVSYELDNPASTQLYLSAGFIPRSRSATWSRPGRPA